MIVPRLSTDIRQEIALIGTVAAAAAFAFYLPIPFFAIIAPAGFVILWFAQRRLLLFGIAAFMVIQGALEIQIGIVSETGADAVRFADETLVAGVFLLLLGRHLAPRPHWPRMPAVWPMALFALVCLASAFANDVPVETALFGTFMLAKNWIWFLLFASLPFRSDEYERVFRVLLLGLVALMLFGFLQLATGPLTYDLLSLPRLSRFGGILRVQSIFTHPLYHASCMSLLACLAMGAHAHLGRPRYLWLVGAAGLAAATTLAVKSLLGLAIAVALVTAFRRPFRLIPLLLIGGAIVFFFPQYTIDNVAEQFDFYLQDAKTTRGEGYRVGLDILRDHPLLGVGPARYGGYASILLDSPIYERYEFVNYDGNEYDTVESYWPHLFGETGLLGAACFTAVFVSIILAVRRRLKDPASSPYRKSLCFAAIPMIIVAWTEAFAAANFSDTTTGFVLYGFLGLACSEQIAEVTRDPEETPPQEER